MVVDANTGLVTDIDGLGNGGVFINAPSGLSAGTAIVETADSTHTTSIYVYDSMGDVHNLTVTLTRTNDPQAWNWEVSLPSSSTLIGGGSGTIRFGNDGSFEELTYADGTSGLSFTPGNGAQTVSLQLNAGAFGSFDGLTLTSGNTNALAIDQNGYGMGSLLGVEIDTAGQVIGNYSNGQSEVLAQIMLAMVGNPEGLERVGDNMFAGTANSGSIGYTDAESMGAKINSGYLEMSNVDLSQEFTDMIVVQRAFQATAKVITTSDQLLQELVNLKR
jgi:flagellar hook protein FlgE